MIDNKKFIKEIRSLGKYLESRKLTPADQTLLLNVKLEENLFQNMMDFLKRANVINSDSLKFALTSIKSNGKIDSEEKNPLTG